jgi:hypothetical protein
MWLGVLTAAAFRLGWCYVFRIVWGVSRREFGTIP